MSRAARRAGGLLAGILMLGSAQADPVPARHPQGWAHGFVSISTLQGEVIGTGDLIQRARHGTITSRLVLRFFDGSLDDETTVYQQQPVLRLLTDHHVQHGKSFPKPSDVLVDAAQGRVRSTDETGKVTEATLQMPADTYNGMASTVLMNLPANTSASTIAVVIGGASPRVAHLKSTPSGQKPFTLGTSTRQATEWTVHVELGGVAQLVAPVIGKQPPDFHVLIAGGDDPVFLREDGPLYEGGPIWRVQQVSAAFPE